MRYLRFTNWLTEIDRLSGPIARDLVRRGPPACRHRRRARLWRADGHAHGLGRARGVPYEGVPVGTIKRHATGKGNAAKAGDDRGGARPWLPPADDNEADALAILHWALETRGGVR